jgi:hypothetical protein
MTPATPPTPSTHHTRRASWGQQSSDEATPCLRLPYFPRPVCGYHISHTLFAAIICPHHISLPQKTRSMHLPRSLPGLMHLPRVHDTRHAHCMHFLLTCPPSLALAQRFPALSLPTSRRTHAHARTAAAVCREYGEMGKREMAELAHLGSDTLQRYSGTVGELDGLVHRLVAQVLDVSWGGGGGEAIASDSR